MCLNLRAKCLLLRCLSEFLLKPISGSNVAVTQAQGKLFGTCPPPNPLAPIPQPTHSSLQPPPCASSHRFFSSFFCCCCTACFVYYIMWSVCLRCLLSPEKKLLLSRHRTTRTQMASIRRQWGNVGPPACCCGWWLVVAVASSADKVPKSSLAINIMSWSLWNQSNIWIRTSNSTLLLSCTTLLSQSVSRKCPNHQEQPCPINTNKSMTV